MEPFADFIRRWLTENGRSLDYRLPDGTFVPLDDSELAVILENIWLSGRIMAAGQASGAGNAKAAGRKKHRPGPPPTAQERVASQMRAGLRDRRYTRESLESMKQVPLELEFGHHHRIIELVREQVLAQFPSED